MGYHAQLPAVEVQPTENLFIGFPARFGDFCPKNREVLRSWLNVRVGNAGLRFEIAGSAPFSFQGLPALFVPWDQVHGLRAEAPSILPEALRPLAPDRPAFHLDLARPLDGATGQPISVWICAAASEAEALMREIQEHLNSPGTSGHSRPQNGMLAP
ncbi:MAG TPA: hypothetical protein VJ623_12435 [Holophagaceae bacterium]|nr:hypothetical protein [Holophagaceae bacterium]